MAQPRLIALILLSLLLAACGGGSEPKTSITATPAVPPTAVPTPTPLPLPTVAPTATSLAEGLNAKLATPDPSPNCPEHYPWFFENPAAECAGFVLNVWTVMQHFEGGLMVWFQEEGRTYVLIDDGSLFKPYAQVSDPADTPLPGPDPSITPPEGLHQPVLGFAKFWRGLVPGHEWVRERLGWATAPEVAYSAFWQCNTAGGDEARCYFNGPRDEIIVMTRGAALYWNYWQGPVR